MSNRENEHDLWTRTLRQHVERRPIVVLRIEDDEASGLAASRNGMSEFTLVRPHPLLQGVQTPCLCLIFTRDQTGENAPLAYAAVLQSKGAVSTLDSRMKVRRSVLLAPSTAGELAEKIGDRRFYRDLQQRITRPDSVLVLPAGLGSAVLEALLSVTENHGALRTVTAGLHRPSAGSIESLQLDAVETAMKAFGLSPDAIAVNMDLSAGTRTSLVRARVMEDAVIEHDARQMPGYDLVGSDVTGRATFRRGTETLEVITANRRKLEEAFGVDLIYVNLLHESVVMVQYKMLEPNRDEEPSDWVYREDEHLGKQLAAMDVFSRQSRAQVGYRLNHEAFYFKFVRRRGPSAHSNVLIPLEHLRHLLRDPSLRTRRGSVKISYASLDGRYMRQTAFFSLMQSGYIGADAPNTRHLRTLIEEVLAGNDAVVLAVQRATSRDEQESDRQRAVERYCDS